MAQVNIIKTPTDEVLEIANQEYTVVDKRGRTIKLKKPNLVCHLDLAAALGNDKSKIEHITAMLLPLYFITTIDGEPVGALKSENELRALYSRLDEDGMIAIAGEIAKNWGNKPSLEEEKDAIKK